MIRNLIRSDKRYFYVSSEILKLRTIVKNDFWVLMVMSDHPEYNDLLIANELDMDLSDVINSIASLQENGMVEYKGRFHGKVNRNIPDDVREQLLNNARCEHCGSFEDLQIDHVVPIAKGGTNKVKNLQVLCKKCNQRKGART